jgi:hypothetical protein
MSHITAPKDGTVTQMNTNTTQQIARAVNIDSPNATTVTTNTSSTEQINQQDGLSGTSLPYGTTQANHNTTVQFAIAANYNSPDATAIARGCYEPAASKAAFLSIRQTNAMR